MPCDVASIRAFVTLPKQQYEPAKLEGMAAAFNERYLRDNKRKLPENLCPWPDLPETYRIASREQARYAVRTCHAHPTLEEALKEAALAVDDRALHS